MTLPRQKLVEQAIRFGSPERVPIVFWNRDQERGDIVLYHLALGAPGDGTPNAWTWTENEWGYRLESLGDGTMGHPVESFYPDLPTPEPIRVPALRESERIASWACRRRITAPAPRHSASLVVLNRTPSSASCIMEREDIR